MTSSVPKNKLNCILQIIAERRWSGMSWGNFYGVDLLAVKKLELHEMSVDLSVLPYKSDEVAQGDISKELARIYLWWCVFLRISQLALRPRVVLRTKVSFQGTVFFDQLIGALELTVAVHASETRQYEIRLAECRTLVSKPSCRTWNWPRSAQLSVSMENLKVIYGVSFSFIAEW